jgi:hypothetical protein
MVATTIAAPSASAEPNFDGWITSDYARLADSSTVQMDVPGDNDSAYAYNSNLNMPVLAGDVVSFRMDTNQGAYCTDYYPYVYVVVDGRGFASYHDGSPCPGETTWTQDDGRVNFTLSEDGVLGYVEIFYYDDDGSGSGGSVAISDLRVNDQPILFQNEVEPEPEPVPTATAYGAALSKKRHNCRIRTYAFLDAALEGQVASPAQRTFSTRVDGRVRRVLTLSAGEEGRTRLRLRAHTGKHVITVRTEDGQLLDRIRKGTRRC